MRRRSIALGGALLVAGVIAACSGDDAGEAASTTTTTVAPTTTGGEPTTTLVGPSPEAPDEVELALRGDGLGVVDLGAAPDDAIAAVRAVLGEPSADTGWESSFSSYGTCPGEQIRGVEWGALVLLFTNGATAEGDGEHLFAWRVTGAPPAVGTALGLGFGATVADAQDLYPGLVELTPPQDPFPGFLTILAPGGPITAYLDDNSTITNLEAGVPCGE